MNRTCNGDVFARWGETWARCLLDSTLFQITAPIETCPNCGRPWDGSEIQRDGRQLPWDPDKDPRVMVADRDRRIAALESELAAERARANAEAAGHAARRSAERDALRADLDDARADGERKAALLNATATALKVNPSDAPQNWSTIPAVAAQLQADLARRDAFMVNQCAESVRAMGRSLQLEGRTIGALVAAVREGFTQAGGHGTQPESGETREQAIEACARAGMAATIAADCPITPYDHPATDRDAWHDWVEEVLRGDDPRKNMAGSDEFKAAVIAEARRHPILADSPAVAVPAPAPGGKENP